MLMPGQRRARAHEFVSQYHDDLGEMQPNTDENMASVAMLERNYQVRGQTRQHYLLGVVAVGDKWRMLKHTLAIDTVNKPFGLNYMSEASIQNGRKLTIPYVQLDETRLYVGKNTVEDRIWSDGAMQRETRAGIHPLPIMLDNFGAMVTEAKEAGWQIL